jgi:hypothetical protein
VKNVTTFEVEEDRYKEAHRRERFSNELALVYVDGGHQATYQDAITSRRARFAGARGGYLTSW